MEGKGIGEEGTGEILEMDIRGRLTNTRIRNQERMSEGFVKDKSKEATSKLREEAVRRKGRGTD